MPTFFLLLFKINLVLVVFAAAYYLVLKKLTFYSINRAFLMFGILFSTLYPFINLSNLTERYKKITSIVPQFSQEVTEYISPERIDYWQAANVIFWIGVLIMASRLALQFMSLYRIHKNSKPVDSDDNIRLLTDDLGPFSFWQTIYINPNLHDKLDLENILKHERVHVEQWHTLDIIVAEISLVFYWFNPGIWLMKNAVRENIEFLTDAKILKNGIDKKTYQYSLLHAGTLVPAMAIVNNFSLSDLKKRIKMMNARRSSPLALSRYFFLVPVLLLTTLAFTINKQVETGRVMNLKPGAPNTEAGIKQLQSPGESKKKVAKSVKKSSYLNVPTKDSLKRLLIIQAFDIDSNHMANDLDVLPEPHPGDRIKLITVRRTNSDDKATFSLTDSLPGDKGKIFIVHRDGDRTPAPELMPGRIRGSLPPELNPNFEMKFFLNGKEITKEEFTKLELRDKMPGSKKLVIDVKKN